MGLFSEILGKREVLERRIVHLETRVDDRGVDYRGRSYDRREIAALRAGAEALRLMELVRDLVRIDSDDDAAPEAFDGAMDRLRVAFETAEASERDEAPRERGR
jgi:hypothetical protein